MGAPPAVTTGVTPLCRVRSRWLAGEVHNVLVAPGLGRHARSPAHALARASLVCDAFFQGLGLLFAPMQAIA